MQFFFQIALLFLLGLNTVYAAAINSSVIQYQDEPTWVSPINSPDNATSNLPESIDYLSVDTQIKVLNDTQVVYRRTKMKLNTISAIESNSDISIRFSPDYQKLTLHKISVIRQGSIINKLNANKVSLVSVEDNRAQNLYSGEYDAIALLDDIRVGDIIDYSYSVEGANPVFNNVFSYMVSLGWGVSVEQVSFRVIMPENRTLRYQGVNTNSDVIVSNVPDGKEYRLVVNNVPKYDDDGDTPSWFNPYPAMQFTEYQNWQTVAQWASTLFTVDSASYSDELKQFIAELKVLDKKQAIEKAIAFVQDDIRYLGLELGVNSHKPHHPNEVFINRYGDCKDKTLLLVTLLQHLGVYAVPALVDTNDKQTISQYLPSANLFNHVIVKIQWQDKTYWVDATRNYQGQQLTTLFQPNYGKTLLVSKATKDLTDATPEHNVENSISVSDEYHSVDYFSPVELSIKTTYRGYEAENQRYRFARDGIAEMSKSYINYYAKMYPSIKRITATVIQDDIVKNELVVVEHYLIADFWNIENGQAYFELYTDVLSGYVLKPATIQRNQPIGLYSPLMVNHKTTLLLPEHVDFSSEEQEVTYEDKNIFFSSALTYDLRRLSLTNQYQNKTREVATVDTTEHLALIEKIKNTLSYSSSITSVELDPGINEVKQLMQTLNTRLIQGE